MSRRSIGAALAAAAVIGLGGLLAAPGSLAPVAAADSAAALAMDLSAQNKKAGTGDARRAAPAARRSAPAARRATPAARRATPAARRSAPAARRVAPAARRPAARVRHVAPRRGAPLRLGGRRVAVVRGAHRWRWRGRWWPLVGIGTLGAFTVGALAYSPYGYVPVSRQVLCTGTTEDGCILRWTSVPAQEDPSVLIPQCVQYCPQQ